jgi:hypothetical protein
VRILFALFRALLAALQCAASSAAGLWQGAGRALFAVLAGAPRYDPGHATRAVVHHGKRIWSKV